MEPNQQTLQKGYILQGKKNRYIIDRVLGQGAFGITYLARYKASIQGDIGSGTVWAHVAIKEFFMRDLNVRDGSTGYLNDSSQDSLIGRYRRAFMREARNLAGLHHDNIVNVFEVIETNNTVYIVMEYINGGSLDEYIAQAGHLSQDESIDKMLQLCSAVGCMHENRMLHLDIKPKNVMLDEDDNLYLIDFGLSKQYTADGEPESSTSIGLGTPGYAPSEQAEHQDGDKKFRATIDVYALGATMFKMLTGKTPPKASQVSASALDGDNIIPKLLEEFGITDNLAGVVTKAMWPSSNKRYQTVKELEEALLDIKESIPYQESTVVVPEPMPNKESEPVVDDYIPNSKPIPPKPEHKHMAAPTKGFPKWLYAVIAAILIGVALILIIPKSKTPEDAVSVQDKQAKEEVATPAQNQTPSQQEEVVPTTTSKPVESEQEIPKTIALTSISLNKTSLTLEEGGTSTLTVEYTPADATDKTTKWESTDNKVATVNSTGKVTAVKAGGAAIIVSSGEIKAYCNITVTSKLTTSSTNIGTGKENGHEYVDLGLSVKWATCNVGATKPEGYGDYYAWGETNTKSSFTWKNYRFRTNGDSNDNIKLSKYNTKIDKGTIDNETTLDLSDDVACQKWGGGWRMPTYNEYRELTDFCTWTWTTKNGVNGYKVTSKKSGYTDRSIFLPATGYRNGTSLYRAGSHGYYWFNWLSSTSSYDDDTGSLRFSSEWVGWFGDDRYNGLSVRPVCP